MIRQLIDNQLVLTISTLRVEVRTLDGQLVSSRPPTPAEAALAAAALQQLSPLVLDPEIHARRALNEA